MVEHTDHTLLQMDARDLNPIPDDGVELVVTSPPYPMIEMWDELFTQLDPDIEDYLNEGRDNAAFEAMHSQLDVVWDELNRVVTDGGIVVVNIGDATRKVEGESFQQYANHARIMESFRELGFHSLPTIFWKKPTNVGAKFMGSGCIPPNQYTTLEHEYILIFRNGSRRSFNPNEANRYESAYFWEERNRWFSDHWTDITGVYQEWDDSQMVESRERSAAFPLQLPYRLVTMFSLYEDTVLDPFAGTGTTTLAAMLTGRDSISIDLDSDVLMSMANEVDDIPKRSRTYISQRIKDHQKFVSDMRRKDKELTIDATNYPFPVMSQQETDIQFYEADSVSEIPTKVSNPINGVDWRPNTDNVHTNYRVSYDPYTRNIPSRLTQFEVKTKDE